jgi:hypothetical protein
VRVDVHFRDNKSYHGQEKDKTDQRQQQHQTLWEVHPPLAHNIVRYYEAQQWIVMPADRTEYVVHVGEPAQSQLKNQMESCNGTYLSPFCKSPTPFGWMNS